MKYFSRTLLAAVFALATPALAGAAEIKVAVAANFTGTLEKLGEIYKQKTGDTLTVSSGSSGALYTQIVNGAPFDIFFSADSARPEKLIDDGLAEKDSLFVYAFGVPVLWSSSAGVVDDQGEVLKTGTYRHLAIAEPKNAPYGVAAQEVLTKLGLWEGLESSGRVVKGGSISQTHSQIATGAAELGFVALAQVKTAEGIPGSYWIPPSDMYSPISQAAVQLKRADDAKAAGAFLDWLRKDAAARKTIEDAGYGLE